MNIGFWLSRAYRGTQLGKRLLQYGNDVTIYHNLNVPESAVSYNKINVRLRSNLFTGLKYLLRTNHEIYFTSKLFIPALQLCLLNILTSKPYIITLNSPKWQFYNIDPKLNPISMKLKIMIYDMLLLVILNRAYYVITNSIYLQRALTEKYPSIYLKTQAIYNGINENKFTENSIIEQKQQTDMNICSITSANGATKLEGILLTIEVLSELLKANKDVSATLLVKSSSSLIMEIISDHYKEGKGDDRLQILFNNSSVEEFLNKSFLCLYVTPPHSSDSMPRAVIEAQYSKTFTVATSTVGIPEIIENNLTGLLCKYDKDTLIRILQDCVDGQYSNTIIKGIDNQHIQNRFNWDSMAYSYNKIFKAAIM